MKHLALIFTGLLWAQMAWAQMPEAKGLVAYGDTLGANGTASELMDKAKKWIAKNYKNPKEVLQMETADELSGIGSFSVYLGNRDTRSL